MCKEMSGYIFIYRNKYQTNKYVYIQISIDLNGYIIIYRDICIKIYKIKYKQVQINTEAKKLNEEQQISEEEIRQK